MQWWRAEEGNTHSALLTSHNSIGNEGVDKRRSDLVEDIINLIHGSSEITGSLADAWKALRDRHTDLMYTIRLLQMVQSTVSTLVGEDESVKRARL